MNTRNYLQGVPVDILPEMQILDQIHNWFLEPGKARHIVTLNALMLVAAVHNPEFNRIIREADLITIDGYGILKALQRKGYENIRQFTGIDLTRYLLSHCAINGYTVYIYGGSPMVVSHLRRAFARNWPELTMAGIRDGYGDTVFGQRYETLVLEEIVQKQPALLLAGLGSPRQEFFLAKVLPCLNKTVGIGIGGAFDVLSGTKKEAPRFLRNHGWEWCYRMLQDPAKLKRIPDLCKFWYWCLR